MKRTIFIAFSGLLFSISLLAQNGQRADSLKLLLKTALADTQRVEVLLELAKETYLPEPMATEIQCKKALELAEKAHFEKGISNAYGWLAWLAEEKGETEKALGFYEKSLRLFEKMGDRKQVATCLNNIAAIYKDRGRLAEALELHQRSLQIKQEVGDKNGISASFNNIGLICFNQGKILEALDFYLKSLKIEEERGVTDGLVTVLNNIGGVYKDQGQFAEAGQYYRRALKISQQLNDRYGLGYAYNMIGRLYDEQSKDDSALIFHQIALRIRNEIGDRQGASYSLKYLGNLSQKQGNWQQAEQYFTQSLAGFEAVGDKWGIAGATCKLGEIALHFQHSSGRAGEYLQRSLKLARELGYPADIRNAAENLAELHRQNDDWKNALAMTDLFFAMRDSVQNEEIRKSALKAKLHYEYELREEVIKSEQAKKDAIAASEIRLQKLIRNGFVAGFLVLLFFAGYIFRQRNRLSAEKQRSDRLLLNILPAETALELRTTGTAKAKKHEEVTVMFTDFSHFTQAAERLSPEELVAEINHCYSEFDRIISRHGIEKIKTIGDSYMAAAGLPVASPTHAADMVRAAFEIAAFVETYFQTSPLGLNGGGIRIGIHSGPVVSGIVGINKFAWDIWGDTVNMAARMESGGEPGKVNVSEQTFRLLNGAFSGTSRGKIMAKNKGEVEMFFVEKIL